VLFEVYPHLQDNPLRFITRSGELRARWDEGQVELDFPAMGYQPITVPHQIVEIFGFHPVGAVFSGDYFLFEAHDPQEVVQAQPDLEELGKLPMPEVIITAQTPEEEYDFVSRFFAPQLGVPEDPVTGSAHCLLTPYWADKCGKKTLSAYQASSRGGRLSLKWLGDRVLISGYSSLVFKGELLLD
jgi:predicted PhzF superfamily epimerase YddE/YHI9